MGSWGESSGAEPAVRVGGDAADADFEVEVGSGDVPGGADLSDDGAGGHSLADPDVGGGLVGVVEDGAIGGGEGGEVAVGAG